MAKYVKVRYLIEGQPSDLLPEQLVEEFSFHVDINEQVRQVYGERDEAALATQLVSVLHVDDQRVEITLLIPIVDSAGSEHVIFILSVILGNIVRSSRFLRIHLLDLELPESIVRRLPGPEMGLHGIKSFLGTGGEIILSTPLASPGDAVDDSVSRALELVRAGVQLIPDSPIRVYGKIEQCVAYVERFIEATASAGLRAICFVNGNFGYRYLAELTKKLKALSASLGWPVGLRIDPFLVGLTAVEQIRKANIPIFCYSQINRLLSAPSVGVAIPVMTQILRGLGADIIVLGTGHETFDKMADIHASVAYMLRRIEIRGRTPRVIERTLPILTGGLTPRLAHEFVIKYSQDVGFHIGRGILGGPLSLAQNVAAFVEGTQAGLEKIDYDSFLERNKSANYLVKYERLLKR